MAKPATEKIRQKQESVVTKRIGGFIPLIALALLFGCASQLYQVPSGRYLQEAGSFRGYERLAAGVSSESCMVCEGAGRVECTFCDGTGIAYAACHSCSGTGLLLTGGICRSCSGRGLGKCVACRGAGSKKCLACGGSGRP